MFAEFKHTIRRMRGSIIGWGIGLFLYALMMSSFYSSMMELGDEYVTILENFPPEMLAFFPSIHNFASPIGYMDTYFFSYMTIIVGIFTVGKGASLLVGDEEKGILDLLMAYPVSRTALFWGRMLGFVTATLIILLISWIGWIIPAKSAGFELTWLEILVPFGPLLAILILFGALGLMFSLLLPAGRIASGLTGAILVGNFLLIGLSGINPDLKPLFKLTPLYYYQGGSAIEELNWMWLGGLIYYTICFLLIAWWRFQRRDIRVGGEGGWTLPKLFRRSA
jgi:ABC-2 type transport system permease protein